MNFLSQGIAEPLWLGAILKVDINLAGQHWPCCSQALMAKLDWYIRANLKPKHMQILIALDELRQVGRVAVYLNFSQPAISKTLTELERGLGVELFVRSPKGLIPTRYGQSLIKLSRSVLQEFDVTHQELQQLASGAVGRLRVGVLPVAAPVLAPMALIRLQEALPRLSVVLQEGTSDHLLPQLRAGELDLVVGNLPPASSSVAMGLEESILFMGETVAVVCGTHHPLNHRAELSPEDLKPYPFVIPPIGSAFRATVDEVMLAFGLDSSCAMIESGSMTSTNTVIRGTQALSFYSRHLAEHYCRLGALTILPLNTPRQTMPIGMVWSPMQEQNPGMVKMRELLVDVAAEVFQSTGSKHAVSQFAPCAND